MISVCMATYNGGAFIEQQLRSILKQIGPDDEIVLSDDGSTDDTLNRVAALEDTRIRVINGPAQHSPTLNFENAMKQAKGDYIFLSDQDDVWCENKVEVMMGYMKNYACVVSDCYLTDTDLNITSDSFRKSMGFQDGRWHNLFVRNSYSGSCMAFRREVMERAIPTPSGILMHDIWLGNVAAFKYSLIFIPDRLMYFRRHTGSASTAANKSNNPILRRLFSRLKTAWSLIWY